MHTETIAYRDGETTLQGYLAHPIDLREPVPLVLIAHDWRGASGFVREKAELLAQEGYVGFALDLYGEGVVAQNDDEAGSLMKPLFLDRSKLRQRIKAAYQFASELPYVNRSLIGAIGFCFGGLAVLELFRSGVNLQGAVSFHGVLGESLGEQKAKTMPTASSIKGSILFLHGHDDPLVSREEIAALQQDFSARKIDWQWHEYGNVAHAFTNPHAHKKDKGLVYNRQAAERAWLTMQDFFQEIFNQRREI